MLPTPLLKIGNYFYKQVRLFNWFLILFFQISFAIGDNMNFQYFLKTVFNQWVFLMWWLKDLGLRNRELQNGQGTLVPSWKWVDLWFFLVFFSEKATSQISHTYGFFPSCTDSTWLFIWIFWENVALQGGTGQLKGFFNSCTAPMCVFNRHFVDNDLPQMWHWCGEFLSGLLVTLGSITMTLSIFIARRNDHKSTHFRKWVRNWKTFCSIHFTNIHFSKKKIEFS